MNHRLPPRRAEREARLLQRLRHSIERIRADGEDCRHDHDGEHERRREHAEARRRAERIAHVRHEQHQADVAVDDRRDGDVEIRRRAHDVLEPDWSDLREEDGAEQAERRADGNRKECRHQRAHDERERAELAERRIPARTEEELQRTDLCERHEALAADEEDDGKDDDGHEKGSRNEEIPPALVVE